MPHGAPVTFDPLQLARELDQVRTRLDEALKEIAAGVPALEGARDVEADATDGFEADSAAGLRLLSALGAYAGKPHIAKLVRRHRRRSR